MDARLVVNANFRVLRVHRVDLLLERNRMSQELANYMTLHDFKTGVEEGKTFTQTLDEFNTSNGVRQRICRDKRDYTTEYTRYC